MGPRHSRLHGSDLVPAPRQRAGQALRPVARGHAHHHDGKEPPDAVRSSAGVPRRSRKVVAFRAMLRRSSNVAAVALALVLGVVDTFKERGQDNALVAPIATWAVVDRLRIVAEADDWPAADRTDLHRRHGARSVKRGRARDPARVGLSQTEDKLRGERSLTVARPGAKPGARPLSRFGACAGLAIPRQSFARWRQSGARSERPRDCRAAEKCDELAPFQLIELHSIEAIHVASLHPANRLSHLA